MQDRWGHVGLGIINYHGGFNSTYLPVLEWLDNKIPASAWNLLDPLMNALQAAYGDYDAEMRGFYSAVIAAYPWANSSGIFTFDKVLEAGGIACETSYSIAVAVQLIMLQMAYEFGAMCTSIAANQENGAFLGFMFSSFFERWPNASAATSRWQAPSSTHATSTTTSP